MFGRAACMPGRPLWVRRTPPAAPANEPAHHVFRNSARRGGAGGPPGVRARRRPGLDPWAGEPKRPERNAEHRQTDIAAASMAAPGAQVSTGAGRPRRPPTGGSQMSRLLGDGCPAGREPERTPPRTKAAGNPTVFIICVLSPGQLLPAVLLSAGPGIR